jgi:hypothetical protein
MTQLKIKINIKVIVILRHSLKLGTSQGDAYTEDNHSSGAGGGGPVMGIE